MKTNHINVTPVKFYTPPKYPTIMLAKNDPKLLRKLPSRWEKNAAVVVSMGMIGAMTLTSCGISNTNAILQGQEIVCEVTCEIPENEEPEETEDPFILMGVPAAYDFTTEQEVTEIIPEVEIPSEEFFDYWDDSYVKILAGTGGPPVFLSEQEVFAIIKSEVNPEGLKFENEPLELTDTLIKLYDPEKQVEVSYYFTEAERENYITPAGIAVGVFYEPGTDSELFDKYWEKINQLYETYYNKNNPDEYYKKYDELRAEYQAEVKLLLEENLRAQVQDFIEWLQGQGIV